MTVHDDDAGSGRDDSAGSESDRAAERVAQLLTSLADDPAAPPSRVTASSVIAAAKAAARAEPAASADDQPDAPDEPPEPIAAAPTAELIEFRPRRRRFAVAGLVAAASLAGISALVISLTVAGGSSTSTSADGARAVSAEAAGSSDSEGAAAMAQPPAADLTQSAAGSNPPGQLEAAGAPQDAGAAAGDSAAAGSGRDIPSSAGCWPALSDRALAALTGVLPSGAYGSPLPLTADCEPGAVGGVILPGTAPGTALVVRVSAAAPAACLSDTSLGIPCAAGGDNVYLASDAAGSPVVYAYGIGDQVVVSGWPAAGDSAALPSGLTVEQSVAAAEAVLEALP